MDPLSQILKALRLEAGIFFDAEFTTPWCIDSAPGRDDTRRILPRAEHVAIYHLLVEGSCRARLPDEAAAVELATGDLIMFPHGDGHLLGSDVRRPALPAATLVQASPGGGLARIVHGGGGDRTRFICGYVACDSRLCRPLIAALPRMLRVRLAVLAAGVACSLALGAAFVARAADEPAGPPPSVPPTSRSAAAPAAAASTPGSPSSPGPTGR